MRLCSRSPLIRMFPRFIFICLKTMKYKILNYIENQSMIFLFLYITLYMYFLLTNAVVLKYTHKVSNRSITPHNATSIKFLYSQSEYSDQLTLKFSCRAPFWQFRIFKTLLFVLDYVFHFQNYLLIPYEQ